MAPFKHGNEFLSEIGGESTASRVVEHRREGLRRKRRLKLKLGVISRQKLSFWVCFFGVLFLIYLAVFGIELFYQGLLSIFFVFVLLKNFCIHEDDFP